MDKVIFLGLFVVLVFVLFVLCCLYSKHDDDISRWG